MLRLEKRCRVETAVIAIMRISESIHVFFATVAPVVGAFLALVPFHNLFIIVYVSRVSCECVSVTLMTTMCVPFLRLLSKQRNTRERQRILVDALLLEYMWNCTFALLWLWLFLPLLCLLFLFHFIVFYLVLLVAHASQSGVKLFPPENYQLHILHVMLRLAFVCRIARALTSELCIHTHPHTRNERTNEQTSAHRGPKCHFRWHPNGWRMNAPFHPPTESI